MRRDLIRRLARLEKLWPTRRWPSLLWVMRRVEEFRKAAVGADEWVVLDWYRCFRPDAGVFWARERIASDPSDQGRICPPGRCMEDVMRELGEPCDRQPDGSCSHCLSCEYPEEAKDLFSQMRWEAEPHV